MMDLGDGDVRFNLHCLPTYHRTGVGLRLPSRRWITPQTTPQRYPV